MNIYQSILDSRQKREKLLAVLIDPEKMRLNRVEDFLERTENSLATHIFVGGSTDNNNNIHDLIKEIKHHTNLPVLLFPGSASQLSNHADAVLFLSLLSGRNAEYLIGQQIDAALEIYNSDLEVIPTAYLLIDGGRETSVQRVTQTNPLPNENCSAVLRTALAGQYSGKKLIYLEAGSGAKHPVNSEIIKSLKEHLDIPIIVGGGISSIEQLDIAYEAGADLVVIGTAFEKDPTFFNHFQKEKIHESFD